MLAGGQDGLGTVVDFEFAVGASDVGFEGVFGYAKLLGDLDVGVAVGEPVDDFDFTRR